MKKIVVFFLLLALSLWTAAAQSVTLRAAGVYLLADVFNSKTMVQAQSNRGLVNLIGNKLRKLASGGQEQATSWMGVRGNRSSASLSFIDEDSPLQMLTQIGPALEAGNTQLAWTITQSALASALGAEKPDIGLAAMDYYIAFDSARLAVPLIEQTRPASNSTVYAEFCLSASQISLDAMDYEQVVYWSREGLALAPASEQAQMHHLLLGLAKLAQGQRLDAKMRF